MNFKFHHVTISVKDINKSVEFYSIFGFKKVYFWTADDNSIQIVHLKIPNGVILEIFCYKNFKNAPIQSQDLNTDLPEIGVKHFALKVNSLKETITWLEEKGIKSEVGFTKGRTEIDYIFIKDPDGIMLEIAEDDRRL